MIIQSGTETAENLATAYNNLGRAYYIKGDPDRAIQDYNQAIRLKPDFALAFKNRALAYELTVDWDRAIQDYDQVIRLTPDDASAFEHRGALYCNAKGDYNRALQDLGQAIRLKPDSDGAFASRGAAYMFQGDYARALPDFDEAIRLKPDDIFSFDTFSDRGWVRFYLGQFSGASEDFRKVLELTHTDSAAAIAAYLAQGRAGKPGQSDLQKQASKLDLSQWPGAVVKLYLGSVTPDAVLSAAKDSDPRTDSMHRCEAYFYLGEDALLHGRREEAVLMLQNAIKTGFASAAISGPCGAAQTELNRLSARVGPS